MTKPGIDFSIVLPAFNEASVVASVVEAHHDVLSQLFRTFEIIVIDDASSDGTADAAHAVAARLGNAHVHRNERNLGQAASLKVGFGLARGAAVMHNAFGMPFAPDDLGLVKRSLDKGADVVVIERASRDAYGITRKLVSRSNVLLLRSLFRCPVADYNFVQCYRTEVLSSIETTSTAAGSLTPELIVRAYRAGFTVSCVSAAYHGRRVGRSTVGVRTVVSSLAQTLKLYVSVRRTAPEVRPKRAAGAHSSITNGASGTAASSSAARSVA